MVCVSILRPGNPESSGGGGGDEEGRKKENYGPLFDECGGRKKGRPPTPSSSFSSKDADRAHARHGMRPASFNV